MATEKENNQVIKSRELFAVFLKDLIVKQRSEKHDSSYVIGLSGEWGTGKTTLLDRVKELLLEEAELDQKMYRGVKGFAISDVNVWKYSDKASFLRMLLKALIGAKVGIKQSEELIYDDSDKQLIYDLNKSESQTKVDWTRVKKWIVCLAIVELLFFVISPQLSKIIYQNGNFPDHIRLWVAQFKLLLVPLLTPLLLLLGFQYMGQVSTTTPSEKTSDEVEDRFRGLLNKLTDRGLHAVIVLDNLDRLLPKDAWEILSMLRTFLDNENVTYIVAADSGILEYNIGSQLVKSKDPEEVTNKGRLYLKKTFDLYWPLPNLLSEELSARVNRYLSSETINSALNQEEMAEVHHYLEEFSGGNMRLIERLVERFRFDLYIIYYYKNNDSGFNDDQKEVIGNLVLHPVLVLKMQMLRELWPTVFARIRDGDYEFLLELEEHTLEMFKEQVDYTQFNGLTNAQSKQFFSKPESTFFSNGMSKIIDLDALVNFAVSASPQDLRIKSVGKFIGDLEFGDHNRARNIIIGYSPKKFRDMASEVAAQMAQYDTIDFSKRATTLLLALAMTESREMDKCRPLAETVGDLHAWEILTAIPDEHKLPLQKAAAAFLDSPVAQGIPKLDGLRNLINYPGTGSGLLNTLRDELTKTAVVGEINGWAIVSLSVRWLTQEDIEKGNINSLRTLIPLLSQIKDSDRYSLLHLPDSIYDNLVTHWMDCSPDDRLVIVQLASLFGRQDIADHLKEIDHTAVTQSNHDAITKVVETIKISHNEPSAVDLVLSLDDVVNLLSERIGTNPDLRTRVNFVADLLRNTDELRAKNVLWEKALIHPDAVSTLWSAPDIVDLISDSAFAPSEVVARQLFEGMLAHLQSLASALRVNNQFMDQLHRGKPVWYNLHSVDGRKLRLSVPEQYKELWQTVVNSWK